MAKHLKTSQPVAGVLPAIILFITIVIYIGFGVADLTVPGPQNDEVADAMPALELLHGLPNTAFDTITILGTRLPLMMGHYIGPTSIYTSLAGMAIFGTTVAGLRISQLILGAITLALLWVFARRWLSPIASSLAVLLCATSPVFLWWSRTGIHFALPLLPLALIFLLLMHSWWRRRQPVLLIIAAFVFGLGITTKLLFAWLIAPVGITLLLMLGAKATWRLARSISLGTVVLVICACGFGLSPFVLHNLPSGASFRFIADNALQSRAYGHNNLNFIGNVQFEAADFVRMIGGNTLHFDAPSGFPLSAIAVLMALVYSLIVCVHYRRYIRIGSELGIQPRIGYLRLRLFLVILITTVIPLGTVSISDIGARHLFIILPLVWLLVIVSLLDLPKWFPVDVPARSKMLAVTSIVVVLTVNHTITNNLVQSYLDKTGGTALWSDILYSLSNKLESTYAGRPVIALDWGYERSIAFLTQGRLYVKELHEYLPAPSPQFSNVATVLLRDTNNIYLFHTPEMTAFPGHFQVLQQAAEMAHKQLNLLDTLKERDGVPNTLIYEASDVPRGFVISPTLANRNAQLSGNLSLLGGSVSLDPIRHIVYVQLQWQSSAARQPDDTILVHIVDQTNGNVVVNADQQPVYGSYPFSMWQNGEVVIDPHWITLPDNLKSGVYQVRVGVYDRTTGDRRFINDPQKDAAGNSLMLNSFEIK